MLGKNQESGESGLSLPPAPEFGPDGTWPRVETEWLPLRRELFEKEIRDYGKVTQQLVHSVRWQRKDPPIQLPPQATYELTHKVTTGLSIEQSETLASSLGLDLGPKVPGLQGKLSYKLQDQFGLKLNITETEEISRKLTLSNPSKDRYRLFCLWQVDHMLSVNMRTVRGQWNARLCEVQFTAANEPVVTYAVVRPRTPGHEVS